MKFKNNKEKLSFYLTQIETNALKIVSDPSTKRVNKKITKWAMKLHSKATIQKHRMDLQ